MAYVSNTANIFSPSFIKCDIFLYIQYCTNLHQRGAIPAIRLHVTEHNDVKMKWLDHASRTQLDINFVDNKLSVDLSERCMKLL